MRNRSSSGIAEAEVVSRAILSLEAGFSFCSPATDAGFDDCGIFVAVEFEIWSGLFLRKMGNRVVYTNHALTPTNNPKINVSNGNDLCFLGAAIKYLL